MYLPVVLVNLFATIAFVVLFRSSRTTAYVVIPFPITRKTSSTGSSSASHSTTLIKNQFDYYNKRNNFFHLHQTSDGVTGSGGIGGGQDSNEDAVKSDDISWIASSFENVVEVSDDTTSTTSGSIIKNSEVFITDTRTNNEHVENIDDQDHEASSTSSSTSTSDKRSNRSQDLQRIAPIELWLDLRGTAFHPHMATTILEQEVFVKQQEEQEGNNKNVYNKNEHEDKVQQHHQRRQLIIDNIILSEENFQRLVDKEDSFLEEHEVLYTTSTTTKGDDNDTNDGNVMIAKSCSATQQSIEFGQSIPWSSPVAITDPIQAMDVMSKQRQWVILSPLTHASASSSRNTDETSLMQRMDSIASFYDLASTTASMTTTIPSLSTEAIDGTTSTARTKTTSDNESMSLRPPPVVQNDNGILLYNDVDGKERHGHAVDGHNHRSTSSSSGGGLAISVSRKSEIVQWASTIQLQSLLYQQHQRQPNEQQQGHGQPGGDVIDRTDSGILYVSSSSSSTSQLPQQEDDHHSYSTSTTTPQQQQQQQQLPPTALILPLDLELWKIAYFFVWQQDE